MAISLLPALVIIIWTGIEHATFIAERDRGDAMRQVESFAEIQTRITESTRQLLSALAILPAFRSSDYERAETILKAIQTGNTGYINFGLVDLRGRIVASSRLSVGTDLSARYHVIAALEGQRFTVGEYITNKVDAAPSIAFCQPVFDESGKLSGAITATIVLDAYSRLFEQLGLPDEVLLGLVDRNGMRLFFYPPKPTNPVGGHIKDSVWNSIKAGGESGILTDNGSDGLLRFYAYKKLRLDPAMEPYMSVVFAVPALSMSAHSSLILLRNLAIMAAVTVLALWITRILSRSLFGERLDRIVATTARIKAGDLHARVGLNDDESDLGQIANALDRMTETVELRDTERAGDAKVLAANLLEKETLLKEVHHRVKNNLQLILSLFVLQSDASDSLDDFKAAMENRIRSMAMVHEMIYESSNLDSVDLGEYVEQLVRLIAGSTGKRVAVTIEADSIPCSLEKAIPFGLLLGELVTNAFKHAFGDREGGALDVEIRLLDGVARLEVKDDGPGLPPDFSVAGHSSLGLRLVQVLSEQLGGTLTWDGSHGATFTVSFPLVARARS